MSDEVKLRVVKGVYERPRNEPDITRNCKELRRLLEELKRQLFLGPRRVE